MINHAEMNGGPQWPGRRLGSVNWNTKFYIRRLTGEASAGVSDERQTYLLASHHRLSCATPSADLAPSKPLDWEDVNDGVRVRKAELYGRSDMR